MIGKTYYNIIKRKKLKKMTLSSILTKLKHCDDLSLQEDADPSISKITSESFYVEPVYEEIHRCTDAKFILFSAPGAAGKTALSKHIAFTYNGLYWDLSKIRLGNNSFCGTLWKSMKQDAMFQFFKDLKKGRSTLILDAFDEAEMISGRVGVECFLKEIIGELKDSECPSVILFARTECATFISHFFETNGVKYNQYEIGFFAEYNAKNFIREKLKALGKEITEPINSCINEQFAVINQLLGDTKISASFLGYAPVLEALAQTIDIERNSIKLLERLRGDAVTTTTIIFQILDYLLEREHEKVCSALKEKWSKTYSEFNDWGMLYNQEEQLIRILEYILFESVEVKSCYEGVNLSTELYESYFKTIELFVPQHPFLQNMFNKSGVEFTGPAFRDYSLAFLLANDNFRILALEYFSDRLTKTRFPSQLLFDFYNRFADGKMYGNLFSLLYDSYKAKESSGCIVSVDVSDTGDNKYVTFRLEDLANGSVAEDELVLEDDQLYVSRLTNGTIDADCDVYVGESGSTSRIYNSVIIARTLHVNTADINIEAREPGNCLLVSETNIVTSGSEIPKFEIQVDSSELLKISAPNISNFYKLHPYKYEYESEENSDLLQFSMFVRKIMNCLRKHRKDAPAKDKEFIDNEIISKNEFKRKVMGFLIEKEIIYVDSRQSYLYKLNVDKLADYHLNWVELRNSDLDGITDLYKEFSNK